MVEENEDVLLGWPGRGCPVDEAHKLIHAEDVFIVRADEDTLFGYNFLFLYLIYNQVYLGT